jgi:hypothetical protein
MLGYTVTLAKKDKQYVEEFNLLFPLSDASFKKVIKIRLF